MKGVRLVRRKGGADELSVNEDEAHVVSRHKDGEDFHKNTYHAVEHLMSMHKIHLNTPIKTTKVPNFKKGNTDDLPHSKGD
jgi:hypothetical protein